ncbi:hypothetical protein FB45DRAFT_941646 [Roridomyces roridus]|uniref:Inositol-1-monophosphatase n=1 Tax=Roridomyces roridus TaxID=1738132 RepID=A0AAD7B4S0_9AGAR|nr:hypothetical protein FB45DRAFT_941646 [Roridomyces roridus]
MSAPELDLDSILEYTVALARTAGDLILEGSEAIQSATASKDVNEKKNSVDLVTQYDTDVEELVKKDLAAKYPTFKFIGEESYSAGSRPPLTDEPTFCVDPIDGTTNFVHWLSLRVHILGLIYKRRPVLGVIFQSYTGQTAKPLKLPLASPPKPLGSLSQALIAVEWGSDRGEKTITSKSSSFGPQNVQGGKMAHSLRSVGSAALNFALVAQGGLDLYWEVGCWPWDVCAGVVIAQGAGGVVTGSHDAFAASSGTAEFGEVTEEILTGRKYIVVRAIGGSEGETGLEAQKRIIQEFYSTVEDVDAN